MIYVGIDPGKKSTAARLHFAFMQDMIEAALLQFVDKYEGRR